MHYYMVTINLLQYLLHINSFILSKINRLTFFLQHIVIKICYFFRGVNHGLEVRHCEENLKESPHLTHVSTKIQYSANLVQRLQPKKHHWQRRWVDLELVTRVVSKSKTIICLMIFMDIIIFNIDKWRSPELTGHRTKCKRSNQIIQTC